LNIDHVRLFTRVAALQNISQAGKELGLSAAVSSSYLGKLEGDLGVRLIHRTTRRVSLTPEGEAFLPHAVTLLEDIEVARSAVGAGELKPQGKLRVAASASFGRMHLIPALNGLFGLYPDLQIDLHLSDRVMDMVEGGFDLAIRDAELNDSSMVARKLAPVERILCASPAYLAKHGVPKTPEELTEHFAVSVMGLDGWRFKTADAEAVIQARNQVRTDNGEAARDAAVNGLGITLCSTWCCYQQIQSGELVRVLEDMPLVSDTSIWAVYPSSRQLAPKVRVFIDYLLEWFGDVPYWQTD
jgi:DNA-binding transcriptional LysR family regulator